LSFLLTIVISLAVAQYGQAVLESEIAAGQRVNADLIRGGEGHIEKRPDGTYIAALGRPLQETIHVQACVQVVVTRANGTVEPSTTSC
jgi:hypothetical protein